MRLRRLSVVVATLSVVVALAGCTRDAPPITDEQVEAWHALGEEMVPLATEVKVEASEVTTMGGNSNRVDITVSFTEFADLRDSDSSVEDLKVAVEEQAPRAAVATHVIFAGAEDLVEEVTSRLLDTIPGVEHAFVEHRTFRRTGADFRTLRLTPYLYVADSDVVDPDWLDLVMSSSQEIVADAGGRVTSLMVLPTAAWELDRDPSELADAIIRMQTLPGFSGSGADTGCVRTESWAYDVSNDWVVVHPASEPDGACS